MSQNIYPSYGFAQPFYISNPIQRARSFDGRQQFGVAAAHLGPSSHSNTDGYSNERSSAAGVFDPTSLTGFSDFAQGNVSIGNDFDQFPSTEPIANFYRHDDGPWNSLQVAARTGNLNTGPSLAAPNLLFHSYREPPVSEISDSGYGTQAAATQSIVSADPADLGKDIPDISNPLSSLRFPSLSATSPASVAAEQSPRPRTANPKKRPSGRRPLHKLKCDICNHSCQCASDLKKHMLKHDKPFICKTPGCLRTKGFTTANDLSRHIKSVHKESAGSTKSYKCAGKDCKHKTKIWPRLDNFKQHVARMHREDDLDEMILRSEYQGSLSERPAPSGGSRNKPLATMDAALLVGMDPKSKHPNEASPTDANMRGFSISSDHPPHEIENVNNECLPDSGYSSQNLFLRPSQTYLTPAITFESTQYGGSESQPCDHISQSDLEHPPELSTLADATGISTNLVDPMLEDGGSSGRQQGLPTPADERANDDSRLRLSRLSKGIAERISRSEDEPLDQAILRVFQDLEEADAASSTERRRKAAMSHGAAPHTSGTKTHSTGGTDSKNDSIGTISSAEVLKGLRDLRKLIKQSGKKPARTTGIRCPHHGCKKMYARQCDLNKHLKRHTKPYGCTFPKCTKKFGSKNDWKRHENSQHYQLESWRCELPVSHSANAPPCAELFHHMDVFIAHLRGTPHFLEPEDRAREVKVRRIGRNCQSRFWCGFCKCIVRLAKKGVKAWDERFNHIAAHFRTQRIEDWLCVEGKVAKRDAYQVCDRKRFDDEDPSIEVDGEASCDSDRNALSEDGEGGAAAGRRRRLSSSSSASAAARKRARDEEEGVDGRPSKNRKGEGEGEGEDEAPLLFCVSRFLRLDMKQKFAQPANGRPTEQCQCPRGSNGPYHWNLYKSCLQCQHTFCGDCDRKLFNGGENIDFDIFAHAVG